MDLLFDARTQRQRIDDLILAVETAGLPEDRRRAALSLIRDAQRPTITWTSPRPGVHAIEGQQVDSDLLGLMAAHLAFMSPWRKVVRAADIAAPGVGYADDVVRRALRVAACHIAPLSMRAAAAVRAVRVIDGFVTWSPDGRFDIDARM